MSESLNIIQVGSTSHYPLGKLCESISSRFPDVQVSIGEPLDTPAMAFDSVRQQYHSTRILTMLEELAKNSEVTYVLGVASFDLFVPSMNFVFGEARCPGRAAIISTYRLRTKPGEADDSDRLGERGAKEAVHEIGHMLGLQHCSRKTCVMHFSEKLADTDRKRDSFCSECERRIKLIEVE